MTRILATALCALTATAIVAPALAQVVAHVPGRSTYDYKQVGVALSAREARASEPVILSNGEIALRPRHADGVPWLYGLGETYGNASGKPLIDGVTPSQLANTPSGGLVPGQDPH